MTALDAYQLAHRGIVRETNERTVLNREASRLAELLADDGFPEEPIPDLTLLWSTADAVRDGRPRDRTYLQWGRPYRYHNFYGPKKGRA